MYFNFDLEPQEKLKVKMAISPVSSEGALNNMKKEVPNWDFEQVKEEARANWNRELNKVQLSSEDEDELTNFYTAMYHAFLGPTVF